MVALKPDILAHIDLIKKLNANGEFFDEESPRYKAAALKALQAAKANDCLLEVNTGGVYRGYRKDFYPGPWLLGEWQKMGGKVIITSDSHDINSLTYGFDEAAAAIKAAGFYQRAGAYRQRLRDAGAVKIEITLSVNASHCHLPERGGFAVSLRSIKLPFGGAGERQRD